MSLNSTEFYLRCPIEWAIGSGDQNRGSALFPES